MNQSNSNHTKTLKRFNEIKDPVENYKHIHSRKCLHFKKNYQKNYLGGTFSERKSNLAYLSDIPFEPLRIHFDYSMTLQHEEKMIKELIMPPVKRFFENSLSVRRSIGKLRLPKSLESCQDVPIPSFLYKQGVEADLVIIVSTYRGIKKYKYEKFMENLRKNNTSKASGEQKNNHDHHSQSSSNNDYYNNNNKLNENVYSNTSILNNFLKKFFKSKQTFQKNNLKNHKNNNNNNTFNNYCSNCYFNINNFNSTKSEPKVYPWEINDGPTDVIGWSAYCLQDLYTLRPIVGVMQYVADINPTPRAIEEAIWTTLHEITHVLAMDYDLMGDFIDSDFNRKGYQNIIKIKTKLVGLADLMQARQKVMNDYFAFANFNENIINSNKTNELYENSTTTTNINNNITKLKESRKLNFRQRDLNLESKISEFDKMIFKQQVELNIKKDDYFIHSEYRPSESNDEQLNSNSTLYSLNRFENKDGKERQRNNNNNNNNSHSEKYNFFKMTSKESVKSEEEGKNNFNIKFNRLKKLRLKNFSLYKEVINKDYEQKQNKKIERAEEKLKEKKKYFNIEFQYGINRIIQSTTSKIEIEKEKEELKTVLVLPEEKNNFCSKISFSKNITSPLNHTLNLTTVDNLTESLDNSIKTKSEKEEQKAVEDNFLDNHTASIFADSASNDLFLTFQNFLKFKKIRMPIKEDYEEITVPLNFNLTVLLLFIENFSENTKIYLKTPKVVETGRKHFACEALDGVELEHFGGIGSAYSHWSKRILNTEYMIADSYGENYISNFTLAIIEDSGWYKVDYSKSQVIPWGKAKGCEFLQEKCIRRIQVENIFSSFIGGAENKKNNNDINSNNNNISSSLYLSKNITSYSTNSSLNDDINNNNTNSFSLISNPIKSNNKFYNIFQPLFKQEFCATENEEECSITHVFRAICGLNKYSEQIPKQYQYFDDPTVAGITEFGDYCPYPVEWFDAVQIKPVGSCKNGLQLRPGLGETICENCRCFISSLVNENLYDKEFKSNVKKYKNLDESRAACYEARCTTVESKSNKLRLIVILEDNEIICPRNGGILTIEGYKGFLHCPKAEDVCLGNMDPRTDSSITSGNSLFSHLTEKLLNIIYEFIYGFFNYNNY